MKNKKFVSILAGIMAAVMLLTMIMSILPAIVGAAESSSAIREQINAMEAQQAALEQQYAALKEQYEANENEMLDMVSRKRSRRLHRCRRQTYFRNRKRARRRKDRYR